MKKLISLLMALTMILSLAACAGESGSAETTVPGSAASEIPETQAPAETTAPVAVQYEITDARATSWVNSIGTTWVQVIVEITNTGTSNLYLSSGSYDLEDAEGHLVASQTLVSEAPDVIAPGEKGYMYEETTLDTPVEGELTVLPRVDVEEASVDLIRYTVSDASLTEGKYGDLKILGRVENTSAEPGDMVQIVAVLYDADGVCIGQMFTILTDELAAGDKIGFEMSSLSLPDTVTAEAVAEIVYYAFPMQM